MENAARFHISTPPTATTNYCLKRRYTNIPLGTKDRSGHTDPSVARASEKRTSGLSLPRTRLLRQSTLAGGYKADLCNREQGWYGGKGGHIQCKLWSLPRHGGIFSDIA